MQDIAKLARAEGGYQPVVVNGKTVSQGWRECGERWDVINPHLTPGTIMDIGSHYGWFTYMAAQYPDTMVWSLEADHKRAEIQREMLVANALPNVVLSECRFSPGHAAMLESTCFTADVILMLSVAHYFEEIKLREMLVSLSRISPVLIIEYPSRHESEVAERSRVQSVDIHKMLTGIYDEVKVIGYAPSPKDSVVKRPIYKATKSHINRVAKSYIGNPATKLHGLKCIGGSWLIDDLFRQYPGLTLDDLRHFGPMRYPFLEATLFVAAKKYADLISERQGAVTDINIRNVLMTDDGVKIIDYYEGVGEPIYDMPWETYLTRTLNRDEAFHFREFQQMWDGTWKP